MKLSVVAVTRNEEANLPRCLESIKWADEIVVVDSGSTDRTVEIAESYGARVFAPEWRGFGASKREGVKQARGEWILSVDADEVVPADLAEEIRQVLKNADDTTGYYMPRRTQFLGRWILHGGWYPDHILRLFRKDSGNFTDAPVHETVELKGVTARLKHDLQHYSYPTMESYLVKFNHYTSLAAEDLFQRGEKPGVTRIVLNPLAKFIKQYILRVGFLDGPEGLVLALLSSGYVLTKYAKARDLFRRDRRESN
jgi:glycosyltransferase involved in cell wall biosynthesis